ncbi:MAG: hypothetical protein ABFD62_00180 [Syntrophaceae bacterium]
MKIRFLLLIFLFFLIFGINVQTSSADVSRVTVLQTGNAAGHLFACPS